MPSLSYVKEVEEKRLRLTTICFASISIPFLAVFGYLQLEKNNEWLGWFLVSNSILATCFLFYSKLRKDYSVSSLAIVIQVYVISAFLVISGGEQKTGILWTYVVPNLTLFLVGFRVGILLIGCYLLSLVYIFYFDSWASFYTAAEEIRYIATFLIVSMFAGAFEYSRHHAAVSLSDLAHEFETLSLRDQLTKTYNRYGFNKAVEKLSPLLTREQIATSVLLIDIDFFKSINDQFGHDVGDEVIAKVGAAITDSCHRDNDIVSRWGGEEFLVLLPNTDDRGAKIVARRVSEELSKLGLRFDKRDVQVTASIGGASSSTESLEDLIKFADRRLYKAKNNGRNQYQDRD